jgi:hypothetical protein
MWSLSQTNRSIGQPLLNVEDDAADLGKGDEWATQLFPSHWDAALPWEARLTSENAAMLAAFALGVVTKATAEAGFAYTCTPLDPVIDGIDLPSSTVVQAVRQGASDLFDYALIGMCLQEFRIRLTQGPGRDNATMTSSWAGCGKYAEASTITIPAPTTEHPLNAGGAAITINGVDYVTAKSFVSAEFGWNNNVRLDAGNYPGSGTQSNAQIRGRMEYGTRQAFLTFVARFMDGSAELTKLRALTNGAATIAVTGAVITTSSYHKILATFHRVAFRTAVIGETDGLITVAVECSILKPKWSIADASLTNIVVSTNVATATTAAAHGLSVGSRITIAGATVDLQLNTTAIVLSVPLTTTFTFATVDVADATYTDATMTMAANVLTMVATTTKDNICVAP